METEASNTCLVESVFLNTKITAVKCFRDLVFVGEGQYLHIFKLNGTHITTEQIFSTSVIHGINSICKDLSIWLLVWGQKSVCLIAVNCDINECSVVFKSRLNIDDWIVDSVWCPDAKCILIVSAHNSLLQYRLDCEDSDVAKTTLQLVERCDCTERCILYCGHIFCFDMWPKVLVLAGTVFGQVLIWGPSGKRRSKICVSPWLILVGHEGAIFSIDYCPSRDVIATTSDDRTLRLWHLIHQDTKLTDFEILSEKYPSVQSSEYTELRHKDSSVTEKNWSSVEIRTPVVCFCHSARVWRVALRTEFVVSIGEDSKVCVWDFEGKLQNSWIGVESGGIWCLDVTCCDGFVVTGGGEGGVRVWPVRLGGEKEAIALPLQGEDFVQIYLSEKISKLEICVEGCEVRKGSNTEAFVDQIHEYEIPVAKNRGPLTEHIKLLHERMNLVSELSANFPRTISLISDNTGIVVMNHGQIFIGDLASGRWTLAMMEKKLTNYVVAGSCVEDRLLAFGSLEGDVFIIRVDEENGLHLILHQKLCEGKVFSLLWLDKEHLLTCGDKGIICVWNFKELDAYMQQVSCHLLPQCKWRWVSAACFFPLDGVMEAAKVVLGQKGIVCGDRSGNLHLFLLTKSAPVCTHVGAHTTQGGVSHLAIQNRLIYSTGRDGWVREWDIQRCTLGVERASRVGHGTWGGLLVEFNGMMLVLGFHGTSMELWHVTTNRLLLQVTCGGGHRAWDSRVIKDRLFFIFLKGGMPYYYSSESLQEMCRHAFMPPFHPQAILCLQHLFLCNDKIVFATGGEDTCLRLHYVHADRHPMRECLSICRSHLSAIRCMCLIADGCCLEVDSDSCVNDKWFITAGGRAQVKLWQVSQQLHSMKDVQCREIASFMLRTNSGKTWKNQELTFDPETRFMDVVAVWVTRTVAAVVLASSDGWLRFLCCDVVKEKFSLVGLQEWRKCVMKLTFLKLPNLFISAATDGKIVVWDMRAAVAQMTKSEEDCLTNCHFCNDCHQLALPLFSLACHQSGINSLALWSTCDTEWFLATGGDDTSISVLHVSLLNNTTVTCGKLSVAVNLLCHVVGHSSQVVGLQWVNARVLLSTSIDQRVIIWSLEDPTGFATLQIKNVLFTGVPDVKGLVLLNVVGTELKKLFVFGDGVQMYNVHNCNNVLDSDVKELNNITTK